MADLDPALVERMVALVRAWANDSRTVAEARQLGIEARAIVAELPKPIDPDLLIARKICADEMTYEVNKEAYLSGRGDHEMYLQGVLLGLRRGRELAQPQPDGGE